MGNILEIADLFVRHHDGTEAIRGLSMNLSANQKTAIIGPNGAGKTSLLLAIMHAVHFTGSIKVDGIELSGKTAAPVRSRCGMTFQDPDDQLFMPTLLDDVAFGPLNQGLQAELARTRSMEAIADVGLAGLEGKSAHHLSFGQKRSASLATIFSMQTKLLLLDEPGASLDFRSRIRLIEMLLTRPEAMLMATHDMDIVRRLCTHVIVLDLGRIVASDTADIILSDTRLLSSHGLA